MDGLFIDIHTHEPATEPHSLPVMNVRVRSAPVDLPDSGLFSFGIHPWDSGSVSFDREAFRMAAGHPRCVAIGECGIDRLKGGPVRSQELLFRMHARLAEDVAKPVVIHCVRAWDEILGIKSEIQPSVPWIIHGFRGKAALAARLIDNGLYLSFGESLLSFNPVLSDILRNIPDDRFFLESDDGRRPIRDIYRAAVTIKNLSLEDLQSRILTNFETVFGIHGTSGMVTTH